MRSLLGSMMLLAVVTISGCGGGGGSSAPTLATATSNAAPAAPPAAPPSPPPPTPSTLTANTITVTPGTNTGADVTVAAPGTSTLNAIAVGKLSDGYAANTGVSVHIASTQTIVVFGPGMAANLSISFSGPNDIGISNLRAVQATNGTPGVAFDAVFGSSTALGARTIYLQDSSNNLTAFTGGLEVLP